VACLQKLKGSSKALLASVRAAVEQDILNTFGLVRRQNRLIFGAQAVSTLLSEDGGSCAFISSESAERTQRDMRFASERSEESRGLRVMIIPASQETLGRAIGRDAVGVLGVDAVTLNRGMCAGLKEKAVLWAELGEAQNG